MLKLGQICQNSEAKISRASLTLSTRALFSDKARCGEPIRARVIWKLYYNRYCLVGRETKRPNYLVGREANNGCLRALYHLHVDTGSSVVVQMVSKNA